MRRVSYQYFASPCGLLLLGELDEKLCCCDWVEASAASSVVSWSLGRLKEKKLVFVQGQTPFLEEVARQLTAYFEGKLRDFSLPFHLVGSSFQVRVWEALQTIPYGETVSYAELASRIGSPRAYRAVGQANHVNPISIILPCHRVIGSNGALVGYGGGLATKEYLLALEKRFAERLMVQVES